MKTRMSQAELESFVDMATEVRTVIDNPHNTPDVTEPARLAMFGINILGASLGFKFDVSNIPSA